MSEADLQATVEQTADLRGWWHWHDTDPRRNKAGFPDLLLIRERIVWAELKREGKAPTPIQWEMILRLRKAGEEVYVWRPSDMDEIERVLR